MAQSASTSVTRMVQAHVEWLDRQIADIESDIDDHIDGHPGLKRDAELIRSTPDIGEKTAARILAYLGDVRRFRSAKAAAAFVGATPRQRQSGTSIRGRTVLRRAGHGAARRYLTSVAGRGNQESGVWDLPAESEGKPRISLRKSDLDQLPGTLHYADGSFGL